jgi:hypothetical protein
VVAVWHVERQRPEQICVYCNVSFCCLHTAHARKKNVRAENHIEQARGNRVGLRVAELLPAIPNEIELLTNGTSQRVQKSTHTLLSDATIFESAC